MSVVLLLGLVIFSIGVGPEPLGAWQAWSLVGERIFDGASGGTATAIAYELRLPRLLLAALLGACLGVAGTVTQGLFRNALAEPSVLGVSMAAATAAVVGFALRLDEFALWATPALAAMGAVAGLIVLFALAGSARSVTTLLLSGVALSSLCAAVITVILAAQVERWELGLKVMSWLMGSLESRSWQHLGWALPPTALGVTLAIWLRRDLDLLHLGPDTAETLGMRTAVTRAIAIICIGSLVGAATALAGVIGFVGLIVPHVARMGVGPAHGRLLTASAVIGAITLLAVDTLTRALSDVALPPGVVTSLLGAPFFLWLLRRHDVGRLG